jgi:hypothetical protein
MSEYFSGGKGAHSRKRKYLNSSICDFTNFPGVEDLPMLKMKGLVKPPGCLRGRHVHEPISHIALVAASTKRFIQNKRIPTTNDYICGRSKALISIK